MTRRPIVQATALVAREIRALDPDFWPTRGRDWVGHRINVHYDDGGHPATLNWETRAWCDYDLLDRLNDAMEEACLPFIVEYYSAHEVTFVAV